jgi:hypothetical protein
VINISHSLHILDNMIEIYISCLLQDFYRLQPGMDAQVDVVAEYRCKKLVTDMFYEQRLQSIINYHAVVLGQKSPRRKQEL